MTLSRDADVGQPDGLPGREVEQLGGSRGRLQMLFVSEVNRLKCDQV